MLSLRWTTGFLRSHAFHPRRWRGCPVTIRFMRLFQDFTHLRTTPLASRPLIGFPAWFFSPKDHV